MICWIGILMILRFCPGLGFVLRLPEEAEPTEYRRSSLTPELDTTHMSAIEACIRAQCLPHTGVAFTECRRHCENKGERAMTGLDYLKKQRACALSMCSDAPALLYDECVKENCLSRENKAAPAVKRGVSDGQQVVQQCRFRICGHLKSQSWKSYQTCADTNC